MRRISIVGLAAVLVAGVLWAGPASAAQEKVGVIEDEVWTESQGPYNVTGPLIINSLTVEEGTEVIVQGDFPITVAGVLEVEGQPGQPAIFTYKNETRDGWQGIRFAESQDGSQIEGAEISYAKTGLSTNRNEWSVEDSYFHDNTLGAEISGAPLGDTATGTFAHNIVEENTTGVRVAARIAEFELNGLTDNDTGVTFSTTSGTYSENNIYGNTTDATTCNHIGTGEVDATDNWWGTTDDDAIEDAICDGNDPDKAASPKIDFASFEATPVPDAASLEEVEPSPSPSPSPSSSPTAAPPVQHSRTVTLRLRHHLRARGTATVTDGYGGCLPAGVKIKYKAPRGTWKVIKTVTFDPATETYATRLRDRQGLYQATIQQTSTDRDVCLAAASAKIRHKHG